MDSSPTDDFLFEFSSRTFLGNGKNGNVYCCWRKSDLTSKAVKMLPDNPESRSEIAAWRACSPHLHIVPLEATYFCCLSPGDYLLEGCASEFLHTGGNFIVAIMDHMEGGDMLSAMLSNPFVDDSDVACVLRQVADALSHMEQLGFVHGDIKLENILVESFDPIHVRISDFGFARNYLSHPAPVRMQYSPYYLSPELLRSYWSFIRSGAYTPVGPSSDVWALGVAAFILSTRRPLFPAMAGEISPVLEEIVLKNAFPEGDEFWVGLTHVGRQVLKELLTLDPETRATPVRVIALADTLPSLGGSEDASILIPCVIDEDPSKLSY
jgi:serine/threonine protein kinase